MIVRFLKSVSNLTKWKQQKLTLTENNVFNERMF